MPDDPKPGAATPEQGAATQDDDVVLMGEEELAQLDEQKPDDATPEDGKGDEETPESTPEAKEEGAEEGKETGEEPVTAEPDPVEQVFDELKEAKRKSEKDGTDEYSQKLKQLEEKDPVMARLWKAEQRVSGQSRSYFEERKRRRELEKEAERLRAERRKSEVESFEELTEEELQELKEDDPDAYAEYKIQKAKIEERREQLKADELTFKEKAQVAEFNDFVFEEFRIELGPETGDKLNSVMPQKVISGLDRVLPQLFGEDNVYTADQIRVAYNWIMRDEVLQQERLKAREGVSKAIDRAEKGGSRLDQLPRNPDKRGPKKKLEDYTAEEISLMGEEEFKALEASG